ncbi:MAG: YggS family pyridoxal phosphate-dependent enzyme [Acidobacteriota bacterium]
MTRTEATSLAGDIARRFEAVQERIEAACARAGRSASSVSLVAVSKRQPLERLRAAIEYGHTVFGESRVQEAADKIPHLGDGLEWHFIGPLQSNKVKTAAPLFHSFHSVDRAKVARRLDREAASLGRRLRVFVQVNVGEEEAKHGFPPGDGFERAVRPLIALEGLEIVGLMTIPPYENDPEDARRWFRELARLRDRAGTWPEWRGFEGRLSMGMSHDFEVAIDEGATDVRVGTDLFGPRPS